MGWFDSEINPIKEFEKNLMQAIKIGNTSQVKALLQTEVDIPTSVFNTALKKAIEDDKIKTVETLLANRQTQWDIDPVQLRTIVEKGNEIMFRTLHKAGWAFDNLQYSSDKTSTSNKAIHLQVALWKKEIAYEALMQEVQDLKQEMTARDTDIIDKKPANAAQHRVKSPGYSQE